MIGVLPLSNSGQSRWYVHYRAITIVDITGATTMRPVPCGAARCGPGLVVSDESPPPLPGPGTPRQAWLLTPLAQSWYSSGTPELK